MPNCPQFYSTFHASLLKPFIANDPRMFPLRVQETPGTVVTDKGEEWFIERIVDKRWHG